MELLLAAIMGYAIYDHVVNDVPAPGLISEAHVIEATDDVHVANYYTIQIPSGTYKHNNEKPQASTVTWVYSTND